MCPGTWRLGREPLYGPWRLHVGPSPLPGQLQTNRLHPDTPADVAPAATGVNSLSPAAGGRATRAGAAERGRAEWWGEARLPSTPWSPGDEKPTSHPRQDIRLAINKVTPARQQGHTVKLGSHPGFDSMPTSCPGHPEPGCEQAVRATGPCGQTRTARKRPGTRASRALRPAPCEAAQEPGAEARVPSDSTAPLRAPLAFRLRGLIRRILKIIASPKRSPHLEECYPF